MIYINNDKEIICPRCDGNGEFEKIERKNKNETYYICNNCELVTDSIEKLNKYIFIAGSIWHYIEDVNKDKFNASEFYNTHTKIKISKNDNIEFEKYNGEKLHELYTFEK